MDIDSSTRLILVEGLPGTGKTTLATRIADELREDCSEVALYLEGDLHPVDMQWISRLTRDRYEQGIQELYDHWQRSPQSEPWQAILDRLLRYSTGVDNHVLTAYTKLDFRDKELWGSLDTFRDGEILDARVSLAEYTDIYSRRWTQFAEDYRRNQSMAVFECAFFQSHITELLGHHLLAGDEILRFLNDLIEPVRFLHPQIHYIQVQNYADAIRSTASTRRGWLDSVINWVETSPYGKLNDLHGFDGMLQFFQHRNEIEQQAMQILAVPIVIEHR